MVNKELNIKLTATLKKNVITVKFKPIYPFSSDVMKYPVESYYVIIVKNNKRNTFDIANAENTLINNNLHKIGGIITLLTDEEIVEKINIKECTDSDGDKINKDDKYVVFIMAVYDEEYKKEINNFEDFLSSPALISL